MMKARQVPKGEQVSGETRTLFFGRSWQSTPKTVRVILVQLETQRLQPAQLCEPCFGTVATAKGVSN
jgi:hypothetical protein